MMILPIMFIATMGIIINIAFADSWYQPDWALGMLTGAILTQRNYAWWSIPVFIFHDLSFYWSIWMTLPLLVIYPFIISQLDFKLGPGQPQRFAWLFIFSSTMLIGHWSWMAWVMTVLIAIYSWHICSRHAIA